MRRRRARYVQVEQDGDDLVVSVPAQRAYVRLRGALPDVREKVLAARSDVDVLRALPREAFDALMNGAAMRFYEVSRNGDALVVSAAWGRIRAEVRGVSEEVARRLLAARSDEEVLASLPAEVREQINAVVLDSDRAHH
jgi:hypothetical protein